MKNVEYMRGMTLVEALVWISVFTMAMIAIVSTLISCLFLAREERVRIRQDDFPRGPIFVKRLATEETDSPGTPAPKALAEPRDEAEDDNEVPEESPEEPDAATAGT